MAQKKTTKTKPKKHEPTFLHIESVNPFFCMLVFKTEDGQEIIFDVNDDDLDALEEAIGELRQQRSEE